MMRKKSETRGEGETPDFDLLKLSRGEVGPDVADELASK